MDKNVKTLLEKAAHDASREGVPKHNMRWCVRRKTVCNGMTGTATCGECSSAPFAVWDGERWRATVHTDAALAHDAIREGYEQYYAAWNATVKALSAAVPGWLSEGESGIEAMQIAIRAIASRAASPAVEVLVLEERAKDTLRLAGDPDADAMSFWRARAVYLAEEILRAKIKPAKEGE